MSNIDTNLLIELYHIPVKPPIKGPAVSLNSGVKTPVWREKNPYVSQYLEEIFDLQAARALEQVAAELKTAVDFTPAESISDATAKEIFRAREVSRYLYRSQIWKRANQLGGAHQFERISSRDFQNCEPASGEHFSGL